MENSIFSPSYWSAAWKEVKDLRRLTFAALICALSIVVGGFFITVGDNLRVYFTYFITSVGCAVYGPILGLMVAAVTDTLNYVLFPSGAYFPGYLLSEMAGALIYSLFLYRKKITVLRLFGAKFCVNYLVNVGLGCLWSQILYGKGYLYYMVKSLIKNSMLLPLEVMTMAALFSVLVPTFSRLGLLPGHSRKELQKLHFTAAAFPVMGISALLAGLCSYYYSTTQQTGTMVFLALTVCLALLGTGLLIAGGIYNHRHAEA